MSAFYVFTLIFAIFANHAQAASNLYCYSCSATLGQHVQCANMSISGNQTPYTNCYHEDAICAKYVIDYGNNIMVHRSCHQRDICTALVQRHQGPYNNRLIDCQTCDDHNYCNSAEKLQHFYYRFIISTIVSTCLVTYY